MIMVTAPPGTGKTLFMMGECLKFCTDGARCHYIAMGDMKSRDFIVRMGAIHTGMKFSDVNMNFVKVYNSLKMVIGNRLGLTIVPAAKITIDQVELFGNEKVDLLEVITLDGKTVIRQKNPGKIVYTGSLSSGIYIFRIHTDGKAKTMKAQKIN